MIDCGDKVTVNGEDGTIWEVDEAGTGSPIVRIIKDRNAATWRPIDRANLTLVAKAIVINEESPWLIPERRILDSE
jgi:hypothetical protein